MMILIQEGGKKAEHMQVQGFLGRQELKGADSSYPEEPISIRPAPQTEDEVESVSLLHHPTYLTSL